MHSSQPPQPTAGYTQISLSYGQYTQTAQHHPGETGSQYQSWNYQQSTPPAVTNFYDQTLYTTQFPYNNLSPSHYGDQGATGPYVQVKPDCDITAQQKLASCAQQLISLRVFGGAGNQMREMTLNSFKQQPRDFLLHICNAYTRFNECVGGSEIKQVCYVIEPLKLRYAVADAGLDFVCAQGYNSMLSNWQCLVQSISRSEASECDSRLSQNTVASQLSSIALSERPTEVCDTLQTYADCIRGPIENSCGNEVWNTALMILERQARVIAPFCTLAAGAIFPSLVLITASLFITFLP